MANIKSAKKAARKSEKARVRNLARRTAIKTSIKKMLAALDRGESMEKTEVLLRSVAAQLARAKSKGVMHANTASRKLSRLASRMAQNGRSAQA